MTDKEWTKAGEAYQEKIRLIWRDGMMRMEEAFWDPNWKPANPTMTFDDPRYGKATKGWDSASKDPRRRWCLTHDKPYVNDGGGPGAFSFCPTCRYPEDTSD